MSYVFHFDKNGRLADRSTIRSDGNWTRIGRVCRVRYRAADHSHRRSLTLVRLGSGVTQTRGHQRSLCRFSLAQKRCDKVAMGSGDTHSCERQTLSFHSSRRILRAVHRGSGDTLMNGCVELCAIARLSRRAMAKRIGWERSTAGLRLWPLA
jgi:hypothetical protein